MASPFLFLWPLDIGEKQRKIVVAAVSGWNPQLRLGGVLSPGKPGLFKGQLFVSVLEQ